MNIVVATLLLFVEEEEAFYILAAFIDRIPQYYVQEMIGSIVDINVFGLLLQDRAPDLKEHFQNIGVDLTVIG